MSIDACEIKDNSFELSYMGMESLYIGFVAGALLNVAVVDVSNVVGNNANASILNFGETLADNIAGYIDATATLNENNNSFTNCEIIF